MCMLVYPEPNLVMKELIISPDPRTQQDAVMDLREWFDITEHFAPSATLA